MTVVYMNDLAELATLGAMTLSEAAARQATNRLTADDFFRPANRTLFRVLDTLSQDGVDIDVVTLCDALKKRGELEAVGDLPYLETIMSVVPKIDNVGSYVTVVLENSLRRKWQNAADTYAAAVHTPAEASVLEVLLAARKAFEERDGERPAPPVDTWDGADLMDLPEPPPPVEIFSRLAVRHGVHIIFGPPQSGKSAVVLQAMIDLVMGGGDLAGNPSVEVLPAPGGKFDDDGGMDRVLWCYGSEDTMEDIVWRLRTAHASGPHATEKIPHGGWTFGTPGVVGLHTPQGQAWLRQKIMATKATVVVLDTVASLTGAGFDVRHEGDVGQFLKFLHALRDELHVTVFLLHHTNKPSGDAKSTRTKADSMMGSGAWRALSNTCLMMDSKDGNTLDVMVRPVKTKGVRQPWGPWRVSQRPDGRFDHIDDEAEAPTVERPTGRPAKYSAETVLQLRGHHPSGVTWEEVPTILEMPTSTWRKKRNALQKDLLERGCVVIDGRLRWSA